jgi:hypothetical protein
MMVHKDIAAIWIACGEQYIQEADRSAETVAEHMPQVARYLFTPDENYYVTHFDVTEKLPDRAYDNWFIDSVRYTGYALEHIKQERVVVLDTDTAALAPFPEVYDMLYRFDMVGVQANPAVAGKLQFPVPPCFPETDIGFVGWRKNEVTIKFIRDWWQLFEKYSYVYGANDQPSLREAMWQYALYDTNFRYYTLPKKYHVHGTEQDDAVILHGRELIARVND